MSDENTSENKEGYKLNRDYFKNNLINLSEMTILDLSNQKWKTIETKIFKSLTDLKILEIEVLDLSLFENCKILGVVDLNNNSFVTNLFSFFNKEIIYQAVNSDPNLVTRFSFRDYERYFTHPYTSDYNHFLIQFSDFSGMRFFALF